MDPATILNELQALNNDRVAGKTRARADMLATAQRLVSSLEVPSEFLLGMFWREPARSACVRAAVDLKIFETLTKHGDRGANAAELAKPSGAEVSLVARIMKHLGATRVVEELGPDSYRHTAMSAQLIETKYSDGIVVMFDTFLPPLSKIPEHLASKSWVDPQDSHDGPFQRAFGTKNIMWQWHAENPPYLSKFANYMSGYRDGKMQWFSPAFFPVQKLLIDQQNDSNSDIVLVDVGGGKGHDLLALYSAFPSLAGKLILQDVPEVLMDRDQPLPSSIKAMPHDFFKPQPVQHARSYFMHSILHDWNDEDCIKILKGLKPALKPGYSKILIHDHVVPDKEASSITTSLDILMCAMLSARERTESQFKKLFDAAGLHIDKIWLYEPGVEAIIEASLPE